MTDAEKLARLALERMGRDPDEWRVFWNTAREFVALMEAWEMMKGER